LAINYRGDRGNEALGFLLVHIELPALRELEWDAAAETSDSDKWPLDIFFSFLSRSGCTLLKLWITAGPTENDVIQYLTALPSLVDIALGPQPTTVCPDRLMQALTLDLQDMSGGGTLVPNLKHLLIIGKWRGGDTVAEAIESRVGNGLEIEKRNVLKEISLSLYLKATMSPRTLHRLRQCIAKGLIYHQWPPHSFVDSHPPL